MENSQAVKQLISLVHLDIDAIHAYDQAIEKMEVQSVRNRMLEFRQDHQRHVENLSTVIRQLGGEPPQFKPDFKGFLLQGMTALRSVTGDEGVIRAMKSNEVYTNKTYDAALAWDLPQNMRTIIEQNRTDEKRHLEYFENAIRTRVWESGRQVA